MRLRAHLNASLLDLIVLALATWRVSALLSYERGPFGVFVWLRSLFGIDPVSEADPEPGSWPETEAALLLICGWCLSLWIGAALALAYFAFGSIVVWLALPFALSAAAILTERMAR